MRTKTKAILPIIGTAEHKHNINENDNSLLQIEHTKFQTIIDKFYWKQTSHFLK